MKIPVTLSMNADQHNRLKDILFPEDGKNSVAIALCGRRNGDRRHRLVVQDILKLPYEFCSTPRETQASWLPKLIELFLERAAAECISIIKIHSQSNGNLSFFQIDEKVDKRFFSMIHSYVKATIPHGSVTMIPNGQMIGRTLSFDGAFQEIDAINVVGDDLKFWYPDKFSTDTPAFVASHAQAFGKGTADLMRQLSIAVVGCSGTGSPVIEELLRLGVGELILVDDKQIKERNVNRILNSTMEDARLGRFKVEMLAEAIQRIGLGTHVIPIAKNLWDQEVVREVAQSDILIGCMDSVDGRFLLNTIATYYNLPYIDIGIRLDAIPNGRDKGRIREVCGTVHYLQPGRSSLMSRGLFTLQEVASAGLRRNDPKAYSLQLEDGYISGVRENRPAVISVNMLAASYAVNELLARLHPFREEGNSAYASVTFSLASMEILLESEKSCCPILANKVGIGDREPLLDLIELGYFRKT